MEQSTAGAWTRDTQEWNDWEEEEAGGQEAEPVPEEPGWMHRASGALLGGIARTLTTRGRFSQKLLCFILLMLLTPAELPGGGYACQAAMFAVLLRLGFCVPAAFSGVVAGFALSCWRGGASACWQMPICTLLWLFSGLWARRNSRMTMAAAVFLAEMTYGLIRGMGSLFLVMVTVLTAVVGAGLSVLYDGAALCVCHRDELDGETRPLCLLAVCACVAVGLSQLPYGVIFACAFAAYLTVEHAYVGGASQAILCAGILGGAVSLCMNSAHVCAMLLCGGFIAGEIKTRYKSLCVVLLLCGMGAAGALLGGDGTAIRAFVFCLPGFLPFLLLGSVRRAAVTGLIERTVPEEMTQSEAIAIRCASMIHAWARLYEDTAKMMEGLCVPAEEHTAATQCVQLLQRTSTAAHQVCERTLSEIRPDDEAYRRIRYALVRAGLEQVSVAYALRIGKKMEVMLLKPEAIAPVTLCALVSDACGLEMRACMREGMLSTQAVFEQTPALSLEIGASSRSRSGEDVAGDSYLSRPLPGGRHVLALSDGMGSGINAQQESHAALALMAESLRAGYTRAQALDVVNALMLMCTGREMYATMDLCVMDLHSGETAFEKLGACISFVLREGEVRAIGADTLPVGVLPDVEARSLRMTVRPGDIILMMTDGLVQAYPGGEEALRAAFVRMRWLHPQAIGEKLIAQASLEEGEKDDMAVLCVRVSAAQMA